MKRYTIFFLFVLSTLGFGEGVPSSSTTFKGNVTLFDYSSPWAGLNNPALMMGYGGYPNPWMFRTSSTNNPEWKLGRFYFFSSSTALGVNTSFYQLLEAYLYFLAYELGEDQASTLKTWLDRVVPFTGGAFSTEMLAHPTNDFNYLVKAMNLVLSNSSPGFYFRESFGLFSLFLSLGSDGKGFAVQPIMDFETYGSLTSRESTFFVFRDPEVAFLLRFGSVFSFGLGRYDLPIFGDVMLGASVGLYPFMTRIRFESFDDLYNYVEAVSTNTNAILQYENVRLGFGAGFDVGMMKQINDRWSVALKAENLLSPIIWKYQTETGSESYAFDWILPNIVAGVRYTYPIDKPLKFLVNEPSVYCEVEDLLYTKPLALLSKVRVGADVKLLMDVFQVGVGLNQGYPTAGGRVNLTLSWLRDIPGMPGFVSVLLWPVTMGNLTGFVTYYGKELGHYPGHKDALGYVFGFEYYLEFGANGPSRKVPKASAQTEKPADETAVVDPVFIQDAQDTEQTQNIEIRR